MPTYCPAIDHAVPGARDKQDETLEAQGKKPNRKERPMSEIQPYTTGSTLMPSSSSPWSQHGRAVNRLASSTELAALNAAARAQVEQARLDAIDQVAARGMQGVAMVTQFEQQLAQTVPLAASRLQAIGDIHALQVAMEISSFTRGLGR